MRTFWSVAAIAAMISCLQGQEKLGFQLLALLDVGQNPHQIAFSEDGKTAYVTASGSDSVAVISVETLKVRARHEVAGQPLGVAVLPNRGGLAVTRFGQGGIARYSLPDFEFLEEIETAPGSSLLVPLPEGRFLVSTEQSNELRVIDGNTFKVEKVLSTGNRPFPPSATSDGTLAFVPNYDDGDVSIFDLQSGERLADVPVGRNPSGGAVMRRDTVYGVAVRGENKLSMIDIRGRTLSADFEKGIGQSPFSIVVVPDGDMAFVNNTGSHDISVISIPGARTLGRLPAGEIPIVMAVHPSGETLWISSEGSHQLAVLKLRTLEDLVEQLQTMAFNQSSPAKAQDSPEQQSASVPSQSTAGPILRDQCKREVEELHQFFQDWANSVLENSDETFARFTSAMDDNFHIINPSGMAFPIEELAPALRQSYGSAPGGQARYWIENFRGTEVAPGVFLAVYEEWQNLDGRKSRGRVASALFRRTQGAPNGVRWLHVHETWLPSR
ncbi:MAG TPA: hypothetical protein VLU25_03420 [Acidobacteriota bacterium]|nr:hypothetical protein [Acidobacteriota bacterium]